MRISDLQIKDKEYKNLDIDLNDNTSGVMAFIGNNGSGKSNLLESICIIFYFLYHKKEKEIPFNFSITYTTSGTTTPIKITKNKTTVISYDGDKKISDPYTSLPKQIVAIYSGEENRLWKKWFEPIYFEYINNITSGKTTGIGAYNEMPKMLFINKFYWHISLLCLLLQRHYNKEDAFCNETLNIKEVHSIKFKFNRNNYSKYPESSIKSFIQLIDPKDEYTLAELNQLIEESGYIISEVYKFLYIAYTPDKNKILESITIKYNDENLEVEDFSEGEKKLLLIKAALEFAGAEDSLYILDEPDAHIHLNNKVQIKNVLEKYSYHRQIILTTHSPTLTDSLTDDALFMLNSGKLVPEKKQQILENVSGDFWNKMQQNSFISSKKPIILLVEGKHDKEHITNAFEAFRTEYKDLDFQSFILNGETKMQPFLSGLYESDFHTDKIYITVYDNDGAGDKSYKNGFVKVNDNFKKLLESNGKENNSYFAIKLPKPEGITCDCTIETLYNLDKFEDAFRTATNNALGHLQNKSIDEIAKGIKEQAKNILNENSKTFNKADFINFKNLFDLILEIKKYSENNKVAVTAIKPTTTTVKPIVKTPIPKIPAKENHLNYWTAFKTFVAKRNVSFKLQSPAAQHWTYVSIGSTDFKISLLANTQKNWICVQLLCKGTNALNDFKKLKAKYEKDASENLSPVLEWKENKGKQEHHINLVFADNNPFDTTEWNSQHQLLSEWTEKFYNYFKDKLKEI